MLSEDRRVTSGADRNPLRRGGARSVPFDLRCGREGSRVRPDPALLKAWDLNLVYALQFRNSYTLKKKGTYSKIIFRLVAPLWHRPRRRLHASQAPPPPAGDPGAL